jgi:hypothetical protein
LAVNPFDQVPGSELLFTDTGNSALRSLQPAGGVQGLLNRFFGAVGGATSPFTSAPASMFTRANPQPVTPPPIDFTQNEAFLNNQRQQSQVPGTALGQDIFQNAFQEQYDRYLADLAAQEAAVRANFYPGIDSAEDQLGDLRKAAAAVGVPFDEYLAARRELGSGVDAAEPLGDAGIREHVAGLYDEAEGEVNSTLQQIGANFGTEVAENMYEGVREFQSTIDDVLRTDLEAVGRLHEKSSEYAEALATAAFKGDIYNALASKTRIEAELAFRIEESREDLARLKEAQRRSVQAIKDQLFQFDEPDFNAVLNGTFDKWLADAGIPAHEREAALASYSQLMEDGRWNQNAQTFRKGVSTMFNLSTMASLGVNWDTLKANLEGQLSDPNFIANAQALGLAPEAYADSLLDAFESRVATHDFAREISSGYAQHERAWRDMFASMGVNADSMFAQIRSNPDDYAGPSQSSEAKLLRDLFDIQQDVTNNWDEIVASQGPHITESNVYRAPDGNYAFPVVGGATKVGSFGTRRTAQQIADGKSPEHHGVDLAAPRGTPSVSPVSGQIVAMGYSNVSGYYIKIRDSGGNTHYLAHYDSLPANLQKGSTVRAGSTYIGAIGNTGNARNTQPHIHYEIKDSSGRYVDPTSQLNLTGGWGTNSGSRSTTTSSTTSSRTTTTTTSTLPPANTYLPPTRTTTNTGPF